MDANGQRFWMLADRHDWLRDTDLEYDSSRRCLRLASQRYLDSLPSGPASPTEATDRIHLVPQTIDAYGTRARWDAASEQIVASGAMPGEVPIYAPDSIQPPTDLAIGHDGILYVAAGGAIELQDRRGRFSPVRIRLEGFSAWRLAAHPEGGVWSLDRSARRLARLQGQPLPARTYEEHRSFRPCVENIDPPRLQLLAGTSWDEGEDPVALASSPTGSLAILIWDASGNASVATLENNTWSRRLKLLGTQRPYSVAWVGENQLAVLDVRLSGEALVFDVRDQRRSADADLRPMGDVYPLPDHTAGPFLNGVTSPPYYPTHHGASPLHHLSLPSYAERGSARSTTQTAGNELDPFPLDSGNTQNVWHRIYLEAAFPPDCGARIFLAATDEREVDISDADWHEHRFGSRYATLRDGVPRAAWLSAASEIPLHDGVLPCERVARRNGLFTALVQRSNRPVRTLRGRYLHVRIELEGNRRSTPEVWALRVYGSRFSYRDRYLPEIYREQLFGPDADRIVGTVRGSTPADFLERMLGSFEGVLTPLEDRIAQSWLLTDPQSVPTEALDWLGSWIGMTLESSLPAERRRRMLAAGPQLCRHRGTHHGLCTALDVATGGRIGRGRIVVVEDFRLRRTIATILGADLADESDPLLAGLTVSGNSYVGDSLLLGEETSGEFLALFAPEIAGEQEGDVDRFFDQLAHRVTILVHDTEPDELALIRRIAELEAPAHVAVRVHHASFPLLVGMAALVGVDTFLTARRPAATARVEHSYLGMGDRVQNPASLDPRVDGGMPLRAWAGSDQQVAVGESFLLDASESQGTDGMEIVEFNWSMRNDELDN